MYKVEYLVIVTETNTRTVRAIKSLLGSDDDIHLSKNMITYKSYSCKFSVSSGEINTDKKPVYFITSFECDNEASIPDFVKLLRAVRGVLSIMNKSQYILWDDLSTYYSKRAYEKINYIENLMRKLLTKFMFINLGMTWTKDRVPDEVKKSINSNNKDVNFLLNVDFIQLSKFLFSENYPSHKESLLKKLNEANNLDELNIEEVRSLLPESNWKKYFQKVVDCEADYLRKRWDKLYELRNLVAHNRTFTERNLDEVENLSVEIEQYLSDALDKIDEVVVPEEDIQDLVESVASERNEKIGEFISTYKNLELTLQKALQPYNDMQKLLPKPLPIIQQIRLLEERLSLPAKAMQDIVESVKLRNIVVHGSNLEIEIEKLTEPIKNLQYLTEKLSEYIQVDEDYHISRIKDNRIVKNYKEIKSYILSLEGVSIKFNKYYISFLLSSNFVDLKLQQKSIKVWLNINKGDLNDPLDQTKDVSELGHQGNGDYEYQVKPGENLDYLKDLILQSYTLNRS